MRQIVLHRSCKLALMVLFLVIITSCNSIKKNYYNYNAKLEIGEKYLGDIGKDCESLYYFPPAGLNYIFKGYTIYKDSVEFIVTLDESSRINTIMTNDANFKIGNYSIGDTVTEHYNLPTGPYSRRDSLRGVFIPIVNNWEVVYNLKSKKIIAFYKSANHRDKIIQSDSKTNYKYNYSAKIDLGEIYNGRTKLSKIKIPLTDKYVEMNVATLYKDRIRYTIAVDDNQKIILIRCCLNNVDNSKRKSKGKIIIKPGIEGCYVKYNDGWFSEFSSLKQYAEGYSTGQFVKYIYLK